MDIQGFFACKISLLDVALPIEDRERNLTKSILARVCALKFKNLTRLTLVKLKSNCNSVSHKTHCRDYVRL